MPSAEKERKLKWTLEYASQQYGLEGNTPTENAPDALPDSV